MRKTKWICEPIDFTDSLSRKTEFTLGYYYLILKVLDLLDTVRNFNFDFESSSFYCIFLQVFIILKKNNRQLTFLHIYHHSGMIFAAFVGMFFVPGGTSSWVPLVNVFVHAIMYFYYLLSIIRPEYKKSIFMKKTLTQIQMVIEQTWFLYGKSFTSILQFISIQGSIYFLKLRLYGNCIKERLQVSKHTSCCFWDSVHRNVSDVLRFL